MMRQAINVAIPSVRLVAAVAWLVVGMMRADALLLLLALIEGWFCMCSLANCTKAKWRDASTGGLLVSLCYLAGVVVVPVAVGPREVWWLAGELLAASLCVWASLCLLDRLTLGAPTWVDLCDHGPYRFVRHPLAVGGIAARAVFVAANPHWVNWVGSVPFFAAVVVSVVLEERFLSKFEPWRQYAERVRWRFVPGVF